LNYNFDFDLNVQFFYETNDNSVYNKLSEEEKTTNTNLIILYNQLVVKYADLIGITYDKGEENLIYDYTILVEINEFVTFQMMVNTLEQRILCCIFDTYLNATTTPQIVEIRQQIQVLLDN
jgi:hypothetical protein